MFYFLFNFIFQARKLKCNLSVQRQIDDPLCCLGISSKHPESMVEKGLDI